MKKKKFHIRKIYIKNCYININCNNRNSKISNSYNNCLLSEILNKIGNLASKLSAPVISIAKALISNIAEKNSK